MNAVAQESTLALELRQVSKRYDNGTLANEDVNLAVKAGQIHAIVGENGAGKSTVMKMVYGLEQPTSGTILLHGSPVTLADPRAAIAARIGLVPQHLELVDSFTVAQNVVLGSEPRRGLWIDKRAAIERVREVSNRFGLEIDPEARAADLSVGEQQRVEIIKTLYRGARLLLLDEPSALLTPQETDKLFSALRKLVVDGVTVVLITHKLAEVREVSDHFTVLRGGRVTGSAPSRQVGDAELAEMIAGRQLPPLQVQRVRKQNDTPLVKVRDLGVSRPDGRSQLRKLSFDIAAGEILGIAGVEGNGQSALADVMGATRAIDQGSITIGDQAFNGQGARAARAAGLTLIPEDRLHNGVAIDMSIAENVIAADYFKPPFSRGGWLDMDVARQAARSMIERFGVSARSADVAIGKLSGGNMQKLVLGREVMASPRVLIACQPTRGVDIGAAQSLRKELLALRDAGTAVLLISADLDEVLALSDRIAVLSQGELVAHFAADAVSANELGLYMTGVVRDDHATAKLDSAFTQKTPRSDA
jgi:simple sugar transport system ATP-binding protein